MNCPFCGGELTILNPQWVDPMAQCSCTPHLMRLSEVKAHTESEEE